MIKKKHFNYYEILFVRALFALKESLLTCPTIFGGQTPRVPSSSLSFGERGGVIICSLTIIHTTPLLYLFTLIPVI